jgi:hypothetical protein
MNPVLVAGHDDEPTLRSPLGHQWVAPRSMSADAFGIILTLLMPPRTLVASSRGDLRGTTQS